MRKVRQRFRRTDLAPGDQVRTVQGVSAELVNLDDAGRAKIMQEWFNAPRLVTVADARELVAHGRARPTIQSPRFASQQVV